MVLQIRLLGEQSIIEDPPGEVRARSSRTVALLGLLILRAGTPQSRQQLAGIFWPESGNAQALTNLRRELHNLRRVLGDGSCLEVTSRDLCWRDADGISVDLRAFDADRRAALTAPEASDQALAHAEAAVTAYAGEFLPGLYDDWVLDARAELRRQCMDLCALICRDRAARGEPAAALPAAHRLIQLDPLAEAGYRTLMELQAELGDRAGAVSTYHRCASVLERELGVVPDDATRQTLQRVVGEPGGRTPAGAAGAASADRSGLDAVRLVGRADDLARLRAAWDAAAAGRPGVAVVSGGAGVGKTRLVGELVAIARRLGAEVAVSQCFATSGRLALAPVADWLRSPAVRASSSRLDPVWREEVERLVPSGAGRSATASGARAMVDAWQRHRFFEGLARALLGLDRPLLLVLDNLQWCDQETLAFLTFLLGLAPDARLLVAGTLRADDPDNDPAAHEWVARMRSAGQLTEIGLHPLDARGTAALARAIREAPLLADDVDLLQAATGGFPLYVVEAMRAVAAVPGDAPLPAGDLADVLAGRLHQASAPAREIAQLASAVGRDFGLDLLVEASDLDADAVVDAVDELWRRRILTERGGGYDFSHDLLREAAYAMISPPRRWLLHRRLAQGLELLHSEGSDEVAALLAEQYGRGGRPERAVAYYQRAATVASGVFAHAEAVRLLTEALTIVRGQPSGRTRDRQELAVMEAMSAPLNARFGYASTQLQEVLEGSLRLAESLGLTDSMLHLLIGLWANRIVQGRVSDSYRTAQRALALVAPGSELESAAHFAVGGSGVHLGMLVPAVQHFETAARLSQGASLVVGTHPDVHGPGWAAHAHWLLGDDETAQASSQLAVDRARAGGNPYDMAVAGAYAAITCQLRGDRAGLAPVVRDLSVLCERYGFGYYREWALVLGGWLQGGAAGLQQARRGVANLKAEGSFIRMSYWLSLLADLLAADGQHEPARSALDAAAATAQARADVWWLPEVQRKRAAYDELDDVAVARLRSAADLAAEHGSQVLLRRCQADLAARSGTGAPDSVRVPDAGVRSGR